MNKLINVNIKNENGKLLVGSRDIAVGLEKEHKDVLRKIEDVLTVGEFSEREFTTSQGNKYKEYLLDKNDAYNNSRWSENKVMVVCPDCGHTMRKRICDLISYPFNCKRCGDKSTYPNKYMYEFLSQLSDKYHFDINPEYVFEWSKNLLSSFEELRKDYDIELHELLEVEFNSFKMDTDNFEIQLLF